MSKRDIVIEKARELFTRYGYSRVSIIDIAKSSNVTKKTIYSYFKDKDDLFRYFIDEELQRMKTIIENYENNCDSFLEVVGKSVYDILCFKKDSALVKTIKDEIELGNGVKCREFLKFYDNSIVSFIENKIDRGILDGDIKKCDSHLVAFIIYNIYINVMFNYDRDIDEKVVSCDVMNILKNGLFN